MLVYVIDGSAQTIFACCHSEIEVADQTFYLTRSQYTGTGPTSASTDPMPGAWQGSHRSANFEVTGMTCPGKILSQAGFEPRIFRSQIFRSSEAVQRMGTVVSKPKLTAHVVKM